MTIDQALTKARGISHRHGVKLQEALALLAFAEADDPRTEIFDLVAKHFPDKVEAVKDALK